MAKKTGIVNLNLEYEIPEGKDPIEYLENVELPKEYIENSFEIVKIMNVCPFCGVAYDENGEHSCT